MLRHLPGHEVRTAQQMGWHQLENGSLLSAAEQAGFDVMVTGDKNLAYQQNLTGRRIALIVLPLTRWKTLRADPESIAAAVNRAIPGSFEQLSLRRE